MEACIGENAQVLGPWQIFVDHNRKFVICNASRDATERYTDSVDDVEAWRGRLCSLPPASVGSVVLNVSIGLRLTNRLLRNREAPETQSADDPSVTSRAKAVSASAIRSALDDASRVLTENGTLLLLAENRAHVVLEAIRAVFKGSSRARCDRNGFTAGHGLTLSSIARLQSLVRGGRIRGYRAIRRLSRP